MKCREMSQECAGELLYDYIALFCVVRDDGWFDAFHVSSSKSMYIIFIKIQD